MKAKSVQFRLRPDALEERIERPLFNKEIDNVKANTKRRLLTYGTGLLLGGIVVMVINNVKKKNPAEKRVDKIVVSIAKCDLKAGEVLTQKCIESRSVATPFIPPNTMIYKRRKLFIGRELSTEIKVGAAIREVDFKAEK